MKIPHQKLTQQQMVQMGGTGQLTSAYMRYIPVHKITGLDPEPKDWVNDQGEVQSYVKGGQFDKPIEVAYNKDEDQYYLFDGNHRVKQAKINDDYYILAFVQPDKGQIGSDVKSYINSLKEYVEKAKLIVWE